MKPQNYYNMENIKTDEEVTDKGVKQRWQYLSVQLKSYYDMLNNGLLLTDNFKGTVVGTTFTAANTDTTFKHGLGFVPTGYIPISYTAAMRIYTGDSAWDSSNIVLKSDAIGNAQIFVF